MLRINNDFELKQTVFLKTDVEQRPRIVTAINVRIDSLTYELSCGVQSTWHVSFEISEEKTYN